MSGSGNDKRGSKPREAPSAAEPREPTPPAGMPGPRELRVLVVEDCEDDYLLVVRELEEGGHRVVSERIEEGDAMAAALERGGWDAVICDYVVPSFGAPAALRLVRSHDIELPFIVVSGVIGDLDVADIMRAGAHDFVHKDNLTRLLPAVERELREATLRRLQRRTQADLIESERRYRSFVENLRGIAYRAHLESSAAEFFHGDVEAITGYTEDDLVAGRPTWREVIHPDDWDGLKDSWQALATQPGATADREYRIVRRDGTVCWVHETCANVCAADGRPRYVQGTMFDVTDRRQAEGELDQSRAELELRNRIAQEFLTRPESEMFADALTAILEVFASRWGLFTYIDEADGAEVAPSMTRDVWEACRAAGKDLRFPRETWGDNLWSRAILTGETQVSNEPGKVPAGHLPIECALAVPIVQHGRTIGLLLVANREGGYGERERRMLESVADYIAPVLNEWLQRLYEERARRLAEEALAESEQRHRALFEQSPVGVLVFDTDLIIREGNERLAELLGTTRAEIVGVDLRTRRGSSLLPACEEALKGGTGRYEGPYHVTVSDRDLWVSVTAVPLLDVAGEVLGGICAMSDLTEQRKAEDQVRFLALHDSLTGLPNRALLMDRVTQVLARSKRRRQRFALAALNIDRFRAVNDSLGRQVGDQLLVAVGDRFVAAIREEDTVARVGGNEFLILLPGIADAADAVRAVEKLVALFADPWPVDGSEVYLTSSVGVALYPQDGDAPEDLLRNADAALGRAKVQGGNIFQFFHAAVDGDVAERLTMERDLHYALEEGQFVLHYQPQVESRSGRVVAVEALVRWEHPERGTVPPLDFIPLAEETGLMVPIGEWVLREACGQARIWADGGDEVRMAVNLSSRQFQQKDIADLVATVLSETGLPAEQLEVEITETMAILDPERTAAVLARLQKAGVRVALDDFGTGFSSLSHLAQLPINSLKIDRSFVRDLLTVPEHAAIAGSVIALGRQLGRTVVAEGVETGEQLAYLQGQGCELVQGYLFSKPLPADECSAVLVAGVLAPGAA